MTDTFATRVLRGKVRTVDAETGKVAKTALGNPVDGGGWNATAYGKAKAARQVRHIASGEGRKPAAERTA